MTPDFGEHDLDGEVVFDRRLGGQELDALQDLLGELAPRWSAKLRLWRGPRDQRPIEVARPGALRGAVFDAVGERGETYRELVEAHGTPPLERVSGSAELRGAGPELVVVVSLDDLVLSPMGARRLLGNGIAVQVRRPTVERRPAPAWLAEAFERLCALSPAWGCACHPGEYWAKAMSDGPRVEAVGRDFGRFLPGLFWSNFFGRRYRDLVGRDRFAAVPDGLAVAVDGGTLVSLGIDPIAWRTPGYAAVERRLREHLGDGLFFAKAEPDRPTRAPDWTP
ncbi:hypothetical protein [Actinokineospora sp.]|uniref:hypothetical protein n=1 Tax=Actinokineospora sp. TaxID=1872133 RepID=UPI0040383F5D